MVGGTPLMRRFSGSEIKKGGRKRRKSRNTATLTVMVAVTVAVTAVVRVMRMTVAVGRMMTWS